MRKLQRATPFILSQRKEEQVVKMLVVRTSLLECRLQRELSDISPYNLRCSDKLQLPKAKQLAMELIQLDMSGESMGDSITRTEKNQTPLKFSKGL